MLTDRLVRFAKTREKPYFVADGDGLYLRILPKGTKTWYYRKQGAGVQWKRLGHYPSVTLLQARTRAQDASKQGFLRLTVDEAWKQYLPSLQHHYASHAAIARRFETDILPTLGSKPFDAVDRRQVADILQAIVKRGSRVAANRTLPDLKHFFQYGVEKGWRQDNPAGAITRRSVGGREVSRDRALTFDELKVFIKVLLSDRLALKTRLALWAILATGQRPTEVLGYHVIELHNRFWWWLPASRAKSKRLQKVYLSPFARRILAYSVELYGPRPFGFHHRTLSQATARLKFDPPFTPHDFRRTMATRLSDLGVAPHVVEKLLNHKMAGVMAVYNQAEYLPERRAAWRLWGVTLAKLRREVCNVKYIEHHSTIAASGGVRGDRARPDEGAQREDRVLDAV
jgi:integrase